MRTAAGRRGVPALLVCGAAIATTTGCAGSQDPGAAAPTVTRTVLVTGNGTTDPEAEGGDVTDRSFDVGTVVDVRERDDGETVLVLDRWTVTGVDDATLAAEGVPVEPHDGSRYINQNTERTYLVPVSPQAQVVLNECRPPSAPGASAGLVSRPGTLEEFLAMPGREQEVVLLAYTDGRLTRLDTDPRC